MAAPVRYTMLSNWMKHARNIVTYFRERGVGNGMSTLLQLKTLKQGELKGVDQFGNQYYEGNAELPGRHRWVVFPSKKLVDASSVPPEWHGWLHHMNDETPIERPFPVPAYLRPHERMAMSAQGIDANYLPPGHLLSHRPTTFGKTGEHADDQIDGSYAAWHAGKENPNPEDLSKFKPKTERR